MSEMMNTNNTGKRGGDAIGGSHAEALTGAGMADGAGMAEVREVDPLGVGHGLAGDAAAGGRSDGLASGGDLSDNTSIGTIDIT